MESKKAKLATKKISEYLRTSRGSLDPIPHDLIPDILKKLHVKTLARFICISKQYASIIRNKEFKKSYLIKSYTHPQSLIFTFDDNIYKKRVFFFTFDHHLL
ncbi:unnamed protein product [Arabidopsis lyrata]|uniref:F-box domain-containing protein n=1 Tax=Arabidopsis lyrata subsp. lyrata TaxID=81972 RepID=D7L495_ARALL|nr:hypothetical protein ARALYDRAFT_898970 [Arabidopsis lyrata subsp. lyrata]CAH8261649.1 unnamed protein product [Arabidopsis lyrata]